MAYCYEHGIPHSVFLEWPEVDRAKVAAFTLERATVCTRCGTADWEWAEDRFAYQPIARTCEGCRQRDFLQGEHDADGPGVSVVLVPQALAERIQQEQAQEAERLAAAEARRAT